MPVYIPDICTSYTHSLSKKVPKGTIVTAEVWHYSRKGGAGPVHEVTVVTQKDGTILDAMILWAWQLTIDAKHYKMIERHFYLEGWSRKGNTIVLSLGT